MSPRQLLLSSVPEVLAALVAAFSWTGSRTDLISGASGSCYAWAVAIFCCELSLLIGMVSRRTSRWSNWRTNDHLISGRSVLAAIVKPATRTNPTETITGIFSRSAPV